MVLSKIAAHQEPNQHEYICSVIRPCTPQPDPPFILRFLNSKWNSVHISSSEICNTQYLNSIVKIDIKTWSDIWTDIERAAWLTSNSTNLSWFISSYYKNPLNMKDKKPFQNMPECDICLWNSFRENNNQVKLSWLTITTELKFSQLDTCLDMYTTVHICVQTKPDCRIILEAHTRHNSIYKWLSV